MLILNLTQHKATAEQWAAGVVDLDEVPAEYVRRLITFDTLPSREEVAARAEKLVKFAISVAEAKGWLEAGDVLERGYGFCAMIGGAPFLMGAIERACEYTPMRPVYAFSVRESVEEVMADGSVRKTAVFRHGGFVWS